MKTTLLCILDGFGLNPNPIGNAVHLAKKPVIDGLLQTCPHATLVTYGERVGLPEGQMGNSEVGHLNIGAGREVEQWLLKISRGLKGTFLSDSPSYSRFISSLVPEGKIHLVGLFSTGGVHSEKMHLSLLIERLTSTVKNDIVLHLISDGRDVSPHAFKDDLLQLIKDISTKPTVTIGSVCGRFFAMDRDKRWERVEKAYSAITSGKGTPVSASGLERAILDSYAAGVTDEFIEPLVTEGCAFGAQDSVVFWNFRADRMREIVAAIALPTFENFTRNAPVPPAERVLCFTDYDPTYKLPYLFEQGEIKNHLGEVVSNAGLAQLRIAETEKYPHVTYFLNGGIEEPYKGEERVVVPSPRDVKTYDLKPEMSAFGVTEEVVKGIRSEKYGLIVVNIANCDMVGHTGVLEAGIKAVETADTCLGQILAALKTVGGQALIIADHGNAEMMVNYSDNSPHTSHTTFPVPVIAFGSPEITALNTHGALCDVAPTVLKMMGLAQPVEMTGRSLY
jgi:2,3-bisphosphoglycerate-independent phosphoglycerate mutase